MASIDKKRGHKQAVLFSPLWSEKITRLRLKNNRVQFTEIGREKRCPACNEFYPADTEFFHSNKCNADQLETYCKPCYIHNRKKHKR